MFSVKMSVALEDVVNVWITNNNERLTLNQNTKLNEMEKKTKSFICDQSSVQNDDSSNVFVLIVTTCEDKTTVLIAVAQRCPLEASEGSTLPHTSQGWRTSKHHFNVVLLRNFYILLTPTSLDMQSLYFTPHRVL